MTIPFPPYRPTSWELQLPNYRVITNSWRSTEIPEILGSLPEDARLRLRYENITNQQALELLLLWRATAGGYYPLDPLPAEVAAGINDAALADRILNIAPLSWVVADPPRQESIKNLRSGVDIELKSELRFALNIAVPTITCPVYVAREYSGCIGVVVPLTWNEVNGVLIVLDSPSTVSIAYTRLLNWEGSFCASGATFVEGFPPGVFPAFVIGNDIVSFTINGAGTYTGYSPCGDGTRLDFMPPLTIAWTTFSGQTILTTVSGGAFASGGSGLEIIDVTYTGSHLITELLIDGVAVQNPPL